MVSQYRGPLSDLELQEVDLVVEEVGLVVEEVGLVVEEGVKEEEMVKVVEVGGLQGRQVSG